MAGRRISVFCEQLKSIYAPEFELAHPMCYRWLINYPKRRETIHER